MQLGWATDACYVDPASGIGVGDDDNSIAYDGWRNRIWCSRPVLWTFAGDTKWRIGDIIGLGADCQNATFEFYRNGQMYNSRSF